MLTKRRNIGCMRFKTLNGFTSFVCFFYFFCLFSLANIYTHISLLILFYSLRVSHCVVRFSQFIRILSILDRRFIICMVLVSNIHNRLFSALNKMPIIAHICTFLMDNHFKEYDLASVSTYSFLF